MGVACPRLCPPRRRIGIARGVGGDLRHGVAHGAAFGDPCRGVALGTGRDGVRPPRCLGLGRLAPGCATRRRGAARGVVYDRRRPVALAAADGGLRRGVARGAGCDGFRPPRWRG